MLDFALGLQPLGNFLVRMATKVGNAQMQVGRQKGPGFLNFTGVILEKLIYL